MKKINYHLHLESKSNCMKRMMEATKELDQRDVNRTTEDCFTFCYWFDSKSSTEAAMGVCADIIDIF